ncbi:MAG: hypothetical protein LBQ75_05880 [Zoogloeaceae bacterium]|jgi:sugar lactone lactonase YvrE|nr:hypothetical protein [Zoogloeaceae bacterium]
MASQNLFAIKAETALVMLSVLFLAACAAHETSTSGTATGDERVIVSTFVGDSRIGFTSSALGCKGFTGECGLVDGQGSNARFYASNGVTIDAAGNLYVTDAWNFRIRKVTPNGNVTTLAGGGASGKSGGGFADGQGSNARFRYFESTVIDAAGNLYVADINNHSIRKVTPNGNVTTLVGPPEGLPSGGGAIGMIAAFALGKLQLAFPHDITIDSAGNLYVAVWHGIRKVTPNGNVTTFVGNTGDNLMTAMDLKGFVDGQGSAAKFDQPRGLVFDRAGNLYVADTHNHRIRKITPGGNVTTLAGSGPTGKKGDFADGPGNTARFHWPFDIAIDAAGNLYVADAHNHRIRKVTPTGYVTTVAGSQKGFADGNGRVARFTYPNGLAFDRTGNLYVAEGEGNRIRKIVLPRP